MLSFDPTKNTYNRFKESEGLSHNSVLTILEDDRENLWLATGKGLSKFNKETEQFHNYFVEDGLPSNILGSGSKNKRTGVMFFGTDKGLIVFHPDSIKINKFIPPIVITSFTKINRTQNDGLPAEVKGMPYRKQISLTYLDNVINFQFAALSFTSPSKNQYAYMMEGFDDDWI